MSVKKGCATHCIAHGKICAVTNIYDLVTLVVIIHSQP